MTIRKVFLALSVCLGLVANTAIGGAHASAQSAASVSADEIAAMQLIVSEIQAGRQQIVAENLALTAEQAPLFWETYRQYTNERALLSKQEIKLIVDFSNSYDNLSQETAKQLVDDYIKMESQAMKLKKKYLKKFRKVLTETQTMRYFQIEHKLDNIISYEISQLVPLAE